MKRIFDIFFSFIGILLLLPLFAVVAILIKIDSKGPVFFRQERIGRNFDPFNIHKFRTMVVDTVNNGPQITVGGDKRITKVGRFLRKYKIDELPQLMNILKGEMSFVGSRPEVRKYVELYKSEYKKLLKICPGITDPASIKYSKEEGVLSLSKNWEEDYVRRILPEKIKLSLDYVDNSDLLTDIRIIFKTVSKL